MIRSLKPYQFLSQGLAGLHDDESGIAATEYIFVFVLLTVGACFAMIATGSYIKAYRDFLVWWLAHPMI